MTEPCSSEEAIAAVGYLRHSFGGFEIPEMEERSLLRTFRKFSKKEVTDAIERSKSNTRRPSPADLESSIITARAKARRDAAPSPLDVPVKDRTPLTEVEKRVAELRQLMGAK
jgi:hypothetical protein